MQMILRGKVRGGSFGRDERDWTARLAIQCTTARSKLEA